ncbi:MAG TPA: addiction module protein [Thermoanaerobaculia bacterium]|jgi:putative addiction module component (TIGR02574 family)
MKAQAEEVVRQALELDDNDRAEVASRLLDSLEQDGDEEALVATLERRAAELASGTVQAVPWDELRDRILRERRGA